MKYKVLLIVLASIPLHGSSSSEKKAAPGKSRPILDYQANPTLTFNRTQHFGTNANMDTGSISDTSTLPDDASASESGEKVFPHDDSSASTSASSSQRSYAPIQASAAPADDDNDFVAVDLAAGRSGASESAAASSSVDLSLSKIMIEAKKNKQLTPQELQDLALQVIKQKEKVLKKRRGLSKKRATANDAVAETSRALEEAQKQHAAALANQAQLSALESEEKEVLERVRQTMTLVYSTVMTSPDISDEIKEEWENAKQPGGKLSFLESAWKSCLLL